MATTTDTKNPTAGQTITVKARGHRGTYTVIKASGAGADLTGPRGGGAHLIRNVHSGVLTLIVGMRGYQVESLTEVR